MFTIKICLTVVVILLAGLVLYTAIRVENLNAQAGYYLPRKDRRPDGTFADGKWRVSLENTAHDQLRKVVQTYGLLQYAAAPLLLVAAFVQLLVTKSYYKVIGLVGVITAVTAIWLISYREYFESLGT